MISAPPLYKKFAAQGNQYRSLICRGRELSSVLYLLQQRIDPLRFIGELVRM